MNTNKYYKSQTESYKTLKSINNNNCIKIIRYLPGVVKNGVCEHFFISGEKESRSTFIRNVAEIAYNNFNMIPVYFNNDASDIEEFIVKLEEEINNTCLNSDCDSRFSPQKHNIKSSFERFLVEISKSLNGIFIVIDGIEGLTDISEFTNWYKSFFESVYFNEEYIPAAFVLTGSLKDFDNLCMINESFTRMFKAIMLEHEGEFI